MTKTPETVRTEFEDWCIGRHSTRRNENGFYINDAADFAWNAWRACQSLNANTPAEKDAEIARLREALENTRDTFKLLKAWDCVNDINDVFKKFT